MKVTILGCGAATGVPAVSHDWGSCDPANPKNRRTRASIYIETEGQKILVDTSPDLRAQMLSNGLKALDGVLYTHDHADHVHGIDDLREVNRITEKPLNVYGEPHVLAVIKQRFDYVFAPVDGDKYLSYKPMLVDHNISGIFNVGPVAIQPFTQSHGYTNTTGYRIGNFAYSTDVVEFPDESLKYLENLDLWIVSCLLYKPHQTHAHYDKVLEWVERFKPKRTILTHMGARMDYATLRQTLPPNIEPAYDGMVLEVR